MNASISQWVSPFRYATLPDAAKYIRLLEVLDDDFSDDISVRCRITTWLVDNTPSYYAISYTWGDPEPSLTILINSQPFRVRKNCEFVLKQAYCYKKTSYYWIDAICINQKHPREKSMQVSIMGNIYKQAAQVLACVGDHADDSAFLLHKLKQHAFTITKRPHGDSYDFRLSLTFLLGQRFWTTLRFLHAVFCFMDRPYFTRLWILQELQNAQEVVFLCGSDSIPRQFIYQMSEGIRYHLSIEALPPSRAKISRTPIFRTFYPVKVYERDYFVNSDFANGGLMDLAVRVCDLVTHKHNLKSLISTAWKLECQEKRDKIFGLISLINWGTSAPLIPDYTQTEFEVAISFFKALLNACYQDKFGSHFDIPAVGDQVVNMLELDNISPGVRRAVEARRIEPGRYLLNETNLEHIRSDHPITSGWRVSSGRLTKSESGFSTWNLPGSGLGEMYLPFWVQDNDWIVMTTSWDVSVLVREVVEGLGGPIIGHTFRERYDINQTEVEDGCFSTYWDPEDLVIHAIMQRQWVERRRRPEPWWDHAEVVKALNTAICRKETPGSSYALRHDWHF